jgi:hypothetical protein
MKAKPQIHVSSWKGVQFKQDWFPPSSSVHNFPIKSATSLAAQTNQRCTHRIQYTPALNRKLETPFQSKKGATACILKKLNQRRHGLHACYRSWPHKDLIFSAQETALDGVHWSIEELKQE